MQHCPALVAALEQLPEHGTLFYVEHTTAAKGTTLWYPMSAWHEEQERQADIDRLIADQYIAVELAKEQTRQDLIARIGRAKKIGDLDTIYELRKKLNKL